MLGNRIRTTAKWFSTPSNERTVLAVGIASRVFVLAVAVASNLIFGVSARCAQGCGSPQIPFFNLFSRWDAEYYADIAANGYVSVIAPRWEFFPLYPIMMRIFGRLLSSISPLELHLAVYVAGFAISNVAFLASVNLFYRLSARTTGNMKTALQSAILLSIYPAGVFLSAVYSESLFLLLMVGSLLCWLKGKRIRSGVLGFLAVLTRPVGVLLTVPYVCDSLTDSSIRKSARAYLSIAIVTAGYLSFMAYSQLMTGTPFANFAAERLYWGVTLNGSEIWMAAHKVIIEHPFIIPYFFLGIGGVCTSLLTAQTKAERTIGLFSVCLLLSYLVTPIISFPRYTVTLLPMYWALSRLCVQPWIRNLIYVTFLVLLTIGTALFVNWYSFY